MAPRGRVGTNTLLETRNELCIKNSNGQPATGPRQKTALCLCPNKTRLRTVSVGPQNPWRTIYNHPGKPGERRKERDFKNFSSFRTQRKAVRRERRQVGTEVGHRQRIWMVRVEDFSFLLARFSNPRK